MSNNSPQVAYFCMEYGLDERMPLYAGGLGILAGDFLKAAKKTKAPVVGIGIWWKQDYTHQFINEEGYPYDTFPQNENYEFLEDTNTEITLQLKNNEITCKIFKVTAFDNAPLYLLDARMPEEQKKSPTSKLYSGDDRQRIAQEIILGIGGIRALRKLGIKVDKYHFNEGHAAFAGFELIREQMEDNGLDFEEARNKIRKKIVFTTHTPVPAGNETHELSKLKTAGESCGLGRKQLEKIGGNPFNMTAACLKMASIANGVSQKHQKTAQKMWSGLQDSAPIIAVTNGVNQETWQSTKIKNSFQNSFAHLWDIHRELKNNLVDYISQKTDARMKPENIIIGFARRAAPYKRSELIFRDTKQIEEFLHQGKLQLVFSGKAHPDDHYGKNIVARLVKMDKKFADSIVFLENYDMEIARYLVQGCDVWLNNPRRPLEASGTSGMKVALNGGLNLSVLDGWVVEGINHGENGWILDEVHHEFADNLKQDEKDYRALYKILKEEVIPLYYDNRPQWIKMMQASIEMAQEKFTAERMINEYFEKMYKKDMAPALD
ncbi:MAG: alpha-glucan family phosphorylase [Bacillota bacterium]